MTPRGDEKRGALCVSGIPSTYLIPATDMETHGTWLKLLSFWTAHLLVLSLTFLPTPVWTAQPSHTPHRDLTLWQPPLGLPKPARYFSTSPNSRCGGSEPGSHWPGPQMHAQDQICLPGRVQDTNATL